MTCESRLSVKKNVYPIPHSKNELQVDESGRNFNGRVCKLGVMNSQDEKKVINLLSDLAKTNLQLENVNNQLDKLEKSSLEKNRAAVKTILAQNVLKTTVTKLDEFSQQLDLIQVDLKNNYLITSSEGMVEVIIPFVKKHSIKEVDFSLFKDQIHGNALELFLKEVPETQITTLTLSKAKISVLSSEEKKQIMNLKKIGISLKATT